MSGEILEPSEPNLNQRASLFGGQPSYLMWNLPLQRQIRLALEPTESSGLDTPEELVIR